MTKAGQKRSYESAKIIRYLGHTKLNNDAMSAVTIPDKMSFIVGFCINTAVRPEVRAFCFLRLLVSLCSPVWPAYSMCAGLHVCCQLVHDPYVLAWAWVPTKVCLLSSLCV